MSERMRSAPLVDVATITMGQSPPASSLNTDEQGLPFLQGCAEFGPRIPLAKLHCSPPLRVGPAGGTLISVRAPVGTINRADQDYCIGRGLAALKAKRSAGDDTFLRFAIQEAVAFLHRRSQGSTFLAISAADLQQMPVSAPSLPLQRRIAEILSTLDEAIEGTEKLIAKHQQIKAGLMHDLFTRGLTPDGRLRPPHTEAPHLYEDSPLGPIPKEWEARTLGSILRLHGGCLQTGPFGSQLHADEYRPDGVPVVMPQNIEDGRIAEEGIARIREKRARDLSRHRVRSGDIIIARRGELSRAAAISDREAGWLCGTGSFLLRLGSSDLRSEYASYVYRQDFVQRQIAGLAVGTTMPSLNNSVMSRLLFPFCEPDEQDRIVDRLSAQDGLLHAFLSELAALKNLHRGLMHDLLTGKVEVPLANDPGVAA